MKKTAGAAIAASALSPTMAFANGSDTLRVGLIGSGGRGTGAARNILTAAKGIKIVAIGDLFADRVESSVKNLEEFIAENDIPAEALDVPVERRFSGFDNHEKVLACDVDVVILAAPPQFRPIHFRASVEAGKHVFMEKPVAVDPSGVRSMLESAAIADRKALCVVAGTQRRHQAHYVDIMKRIGDGAIGEIVAASCYWNMGALWVKPAKHNWEMFTQGHWSPMEYQIRNWLFHVWLSGDHIVEQHVHNLDIVNWSMGEHPTQALGMGGRQSRTEPQYGNVFDHFAVEYEYANGVKMQSMCRQCANSGHRVEEHIVGTHGVAYLSGANGRITGKNPFEAPESPDPYVQEHKDLIAHIRSGEHINETENVTKSTATAILGRMSAYTGNTLSWGWMMNASKLDLSPEKYAFGPNPVAPVARPGVTELI